MPERLRVGVQLPEVEREVRWPEYVAMARAAEQSGFDSIWLGDHLLYRGDGREERGPWEVWTMLAALAAVTERAALGPLVACASFHPPALIAKMAAAVDEISGGRLVLGLGAGWNRSEYRAFGLPYDHRVSRFEEAFSIVRGLLAGERVTLDGHFWQADDAVLLPRPARRIPLLVGSIGPRMLAITLPYVDSWNAWYLAFGNTPEGFAEVNEAVSSAAKDAGRSPAAVERSACILVSVGAGAPRQPADDEVVAVPAERLPAFLGELAEAGADEAILVVRPITEESIRTLGGILPCSARPAKNEVRSKGP